MAEFITPDGKIWDVDTKCRFNSKFRSHCALRWFVYHRDGFKCTQCGSAAKKLPIGYNGSHSLYAENGNILELDHIVPFKKGGRLSAQNTQTICSKCNAIKGAR